MDGMILISYFWDHVLFDTGASHSFISMSFATSLQLEMNLFISLLLLTTPIDGVGEVSMICKSCCVVIGNHKFFTNLFVIRMGEFDVILGMNWLSKYQATVDWFRRRITLITKDGQVIEYSAKSGIVTPYPLLKACVGG